MKEKLASRINFGAIILAVLTFILGWQLGYKDFQSNLGKNYNVTYEKRLTPQNINLDFKLFWDTWDLLSAKYLDKKALDPQKMLYGAISGMVSSLGDPYTVFLPPEAQKATKEDLGGAFEGVGIELGFNEAKPPASGSKDKRLVVIAPLSGTPAEKAGIKPGDLIIKINDKDTAGMSLPDAVKLIRGPKGTSIKLAILRENDGTEPKDYNLYRDTIIVKSVEVSLKQTKSGKKVAVIKLSRFGERTNDEWQSAVSNLLSVNPQAVVLDVRNNPGGFLESAVYIASEFLDGGNVVLQENNAGDKIPFKVNRSGRLINIPLDVLINKGSASASEIVAGALQDRSRAKLIGEKSFGKGTIQEAEDLASGSGIHITVAKWLTPNSRWVNETQGLEPDIKVEGEKEDVTKDPQMDKALELLE